MTKRFRKKPVEIEAIRVPLLYEHSITGKHVREVYHKDVSEIAEWCGGFINSIDLNKLSIGISTLEGVMIASPGDWIIKGIKGEFYPCKPDIFEQTYEEVK